MKLRFLLILLFVLTASSNVLAKDAFTVDGISYVTYYSSRFYNNAVYVTAKADGSKYEGNLNIPNTISYEGKDYNVAGIGDNAFKDCTGLTSVSKEGIIEFIGNSAFEGCTGLQEFTIPPYYSNNMYEGYVHIGYRAFWGCHLYSLTSKIGNPPTYDYYNPSHPSPGGLISMPSDADWIGWDYGDYWHWSNHTTLYVPVGCFYAYKEQTNNGFSYRTWGDFFTDIKEWGVEEGDPVPELYERIEKYKDICVQLDDSIQHLSLDVYPYLLVSLYKAATEKGEEPNEDQLTAQIHDYFTWIKVKGDYYDGHNGDYECPYIPALYNIIHALNTDIETAEDELKNLQEARKGYYNAKAQAEQIQSRIDNTQDEDSKMYLQQELERQMSQVEKLKGNWSAKANDVKELLNRIGASLEAIYSSNILQEKADEFLANTMAVISGVSMVEADNKSKSKTWYTLDGRQLFQQPAKTGVYINNGKKIVIK